MHPVSRYRIPQGFRDADLGALSPALVAQIKLSVMLCYGFAFSLLGVGGLGSLAALVIGLISLTRIKRAGGELAGVRLVWWCVLFGALGLLVLPLGSFLLLRRLLFGGVR